MRTDYTPLSAQLHCATTNSDLGMETELGRIINGWDVRKRAGQEGGKETREHWSLASYLVDLDFGMSFGSVSQLAICF